MTVIILLDRLFQGVSVWVIIEGLIFEGQEMTLRALQVVDHGGISSVSLLLMRTMFQMDFGKAFLGFR